MAEKTPTPLNTACDLLPSALWNHVKAKCRMLFSEGFPPCIQSFNALCSLALTWLNVPLRSLQALNQNIFHFQNCYFFLKDDNEKRERCVQARARRLPQGEDVLWTVLCSVARYCTLEGTLLPSSSWPLSYGVFFLFSSFQCIWCRCRV